MIPNDPVELPPPYWERVCEHDKSFAVHCRECEMKGYCGCPECVEPETLVVMGDPRESNTGKEPSA